VKTAVFVTTEDRFFVSHRAVIARALQDRGYRVHLIANDTGASALVSSVGATFHPLAFARGGTSPLDESKTVASIAALYRRLKPDLVHHSTIKANVYGSLAARLNRVPAVVNTVTGLGHALMAKPTDGLKEKLRRRIAETLYGHALTGITIFQNVDQLNHFVQRGWVEPRHARLVRGAGVNLTRFLPTPLPVQPCFLLPARMLWDKGVGEFVEAAKVLKGKARFVLAGGLDDKNPAHIDRSTLDTWVREGTVEWLGHQSDMAQVYAQASVVVLPSYAEGLPLALAEALACGRPCVTTLAPGCRDTVVDGETGLLVPVRDAKALMQAMSSLLSRPNELSQMSRAARAYAEAHFGVESIVAQTLSACRDAGAAL
jgi:glycosyltransferase involved in cell wall biosynthesis